jgi:nitroimidazol reductase NimA-like FMN-containing flavoprotein (pyridoxamine 5'-phosphate oxidase superfamily)
MKERGTHDRATIDAILDEGLVCHVGFPEDGSTVVLPTAYARAGDVVYLHGAAANRMLKTVGSGAAICVTVTLLDGIVLARSAFHHSMNYRSVVLFGVGSAVDEPAEKLRALLAIVDHMAPGRSADARAPTESELRQTAVVRLPIDEASAKVRTGGPLDDEEDMVLPIWAGVIPCGLVSGPAIADEDLPDGVGTPAYVAEPRPGATLQG